MVSRTGKQSTVGQQDRQLVFQGTWRSYQARVLENLEPYLADKKCHLVAAPGAGKTTIGIEIIARVNQPALVLVPSLTIKTQWLHRIRDAFLEDDHVFDQLVSGDLYQPKWLTVATYQALHQVISRQDINALVSLFRAQSLGTLCLDECHHLKSAWWKSLEQFKAAFQEVTTISLTATPPYDANPQEWRRYQAMCGEVDEEITIPELVKEGSLCPHQDYLAFSYLTDEEADQYHQIEAARQRLFDDLIQDQLFEEAIRSHRYLQGQMVEEELFEKPDHLLSWLSYLETKGDRLPGLLSQLIEAQQLPEFTPALLGDLLQAFLYEDQEAYTCDAAYRRQLEARIKGAGLIERRQVMLGDSQELLACLQGSVSKLASIQNIVRDEYNSLGGGLRLLILTDHIYKDYVANIGLLDAEVKKLGVLPIFEHLRRWLDATANPLPLAILCGSLVVIPRTARDQLEDKLTGHQVTFEPLAHLRDYLVVNVASGEQELTRAMTSLFEEGSLQVLIGTKAFLGEGWDAPCINSLILASTVGSFVLSNQMRGRAIRTWPQDPQKTSNIWHLVTLVPGQDQQLDWQQLDRRFQQFMGLSYDGRSIENGLSRLDLDLEGIEPEDLVNLQFQTSFRAMDRDRLKADWDAALVRHQTIEVVQRQQVSRHRVAFAVQVANFLSPQQLSLPLLALLASPLLVLKAFGALPAVLSAAAMLGTWSYGRYRTYTSPKNKLRLLAQGILDSLRAKQVRAFSTALVQVEEQDGDCCVSLSQASYREKEVFAQLLAEFFTDLRTPRYVIQVDEGKEGVSYYSVPSLFAANKRDAQRFFKRLEPLFKTSRLIYTKNPQGRQFLLEARARSLFESRQLIQVKTMQSITNRD